MRSASEIWRYFATSSSIGWAYCKMIPVKGFLIWCYLSAGTYYSDDTSAWTDWLCLLGFTCRMLWHNHNYTGMRPQGKNIKLTIKWSQVYSSSKLSCHFYQTDVGQHRAIIEGIFVLCLHNCAHLFEFHQVWCMAKEAFSHPVNETGWVVLTVWFQYCDLRSFYIQWPQRNTKHHSMEKLLRFGLKS